MTWSLAPLPLHAEPPRFGQAEVTLCGRPAPAPSASVCGFSLIARNDGPQVALIGPARSFLVDARAWEEAVLTIPVQGVTGVCAATAEVASVEGEGTEVGLAVNGKETRATVPRDGQVRLEAQGQVAGGAVIVRLRTRAAGGAAAVRWSEVRITTDTASSEVDILPAPSKEDAGPPPQLPVLRDAVQRALIEWDWQMQDGIGTPRAAVTCSAAIERTLDRGDALIRDLREKGLALRSEAEQWQALRQEWQGLAASNRSEQAEGKRLWLRTHWLKRRIAFSNPIAQVGPVAFIKQVPSCFSHQLTQSYGRYARPGGGVFVLDNPGGSMACRQLTPGALPVGSCQHLDVSYEGDRILFSFCQAETTPKDTIQGQHGRYYHLYEMAADGSGLRALTDGPFNDFAPRYLPDGRIVFISTRRMGWHRCGSPGCENHTLAIANADGSQPHPVSCHETQEWDPAVLDDGRIIYTRWDYVDRHAVYYEQLWAVRSDGSAPAAFYGNNTFNPVGIWEPRQTPGSRRVMATAAAHHAMTAGSIILVDPASGVDGPPPVTRLTPDVPFPESETTVLPKWRGAAGAPPYRPIENERWPGHCYRSPYPLSEDYFLAAYSFDALVGEPKGNSPNMFGLYLVDRFGNKELLHRDLSISSLWPMPLRPRPRPPAVVRSAGEDTEQEGTFILQNVYASAPKLPDVRIRALRILQIVPKSTPGANRPPLGLPNASPGKQVLGTVPVEADGSACFRAPVGRPLAFQALDEQGMAVQVMRSVTYLQPGEVAGCVGCHESRTTTPLRTAVALALKRSPSAIEPGPDGSRPLSYPILVQPVLDKHCVKCHGDAKPAGGLSLTGKPEGHYTVSYNALAPRVSYSAWGRKGGDFRVANSEPVSAPGYFGARGSALLKALIEKRMGASLNPEEMARLVTWMDANALFYGTFDPDDQARQQRGERIAGPKLE